MKAAFATWANRIAPVFDVTRQFRLVQVDSGRVIEEAEAVLADIHPMQKALRLNEWGVDTLVCGAISRSLERTLSANGIRVIPFVSGSLSDTIEAWLSGRIEDECFAMPGCWGRRPSRFHSRQTEKEEFEMKANNPERTGPRTGRGKRGDSPGGGGLSQRPGPGGICVCPNCGHQEPHKRGNPCMQSKCPQCGSTMTRQSNR